MSRQSLLDKLALQHESQIQRTLAELESQIISDIAEHKSLLVSSDFTPEILRQKTAISIQLRNDFKKEFQTTFLAKSDSLIRDYDQAVSEFMKEFGELNIPDKFKNLTKVDLEIINALKTQSFQGFEEVANKYLTEINANVYQNVIAGRSFEDMVRDISGKLTGLEDVAGRPMSSHAGQLAHDSIMQFDAQFVKSKASSAGLTHFRYAGTAITTTREFCKRHIGQVYSEKQIRSFWSGSWAGKSSGDPFVVRGGYRCRHTWNPVDKDWVEKEEKKKEVKKKIPTSKITAINSARNYSTGTYNESNINNVLENFKGQEKSISLLNKFINSKNIFSLFISRQMRLKPFRKNHDTKIYDKYKKSHKESLTEYSIKPPKNAYGYTQSTKNYVATVIDGDIDFATVNSAKIQSHIAIVLSRTDLGKGRYNAKLTFERKTADWSFSSPFGQKHLNTAISNAESDVITYLHEIGHQVHYWGATDRGVNTIMDVIAVAGRKNIILTRYGTKNANEYHAELFAVWATNRKALALYNPKLVEYMDDLVARAIKNTKKGDL